MVKTFEEYKADADKQTAESRKKQLGSIDSSADAAIKLAEDTYKKAEANTIVDYASDYERNAVQKLINEKQIAEKMTNLGLTDSGLNRTQQTAVQLSYANQKGKLDIAKQQKLDKLSNDLASYVTQVNNQRESDKLGINQFYDQQNDTIATELYNTDVEDERKRWETEYNANVELKKAAIKASDNTAEENVFKLSDTEITNIEEIYEKYGGGEAGELAVARYLQQKGHNPTNEQYEKLVVPIFKSEDEIVDEASVTPVKIGTIDNEGASKYEKFRTVKGDNFDVKVNGNTYRVENKGKVSDSDTIEKFNKIVANNGEVFLYNGDAYLKYGYGYFKLGATNKLFNLGKTPGYQNLLKALQQ